MNGQLRAIFDHAGHSIDVGKIQVGVHALGVHVQGQSHNVDIAASFAIAEQAAFNALCACHHGQLGGGHACAAVIVRVHGKHHMLAAIQAPVHPFNLIGEHIGRAPFHRGGQVDDDLSVGPRFPCFNRGVASLQSHIQFCHVETFGRVLQNPLCFGVCIGEFFHFLDAFFYHVDDFGHSHAEHRISPHGCGGVVDVEDGAFGTNHRFHCSLDKIITSLGHDHGGDVVRNQIVVDQMPDHIEVDLRGSGKAYLDFLETNAHQFLEEVQFGCHTHGFKNRLVAVAQIGA